MATNTHDHLSNGQEVAMLTPLMEEVANSGVVELTFELRDHDCLFVAVSATAACTIVGERSLPQSDETILAVLSVTETVPDDALTAVRAHDSTSETRLLHATADAAMIEVVLDGPCVFRTIAESSAILRSAVATDGVATVVADVPMAVDVAAVTDRFCTIHTSSTLTAKRTCPDRFPGVPDGDRTAVLSRLTDKQRCAIETALRRGYFAWPRESSAEDCAAALGISQPTFSQHLRCGQEKLVGALFTPTAEPNEHRHDA